MFGGWPAPTKVGPSIMFNYTAIKPLSHSLKQGVDISEVSIWKIVFGGCGFGS